MSVPVLAFYSVLVHTSVEAARTPTPYYTDWMNALQRLPPAHPAAPAFPCSHPVLCDVRVDLPPGDAGATSDRTTEISPGLTLRDDCVLLAGAWTRNGFHEDGFASGLRAAMAVVRAAAVGPGSGIAFGMADAEEDVTMSAMQVWLAHGFAAAERSRLRACVGACQLYADVDGGSGDAVRGTSGMRTTVWLPQRSWSLRLCDNAIFQRSVHIRCCALLHQPELVRMPLRFDCAQGRDPRGVRTLSLAGTGRPEKWSTSAVINYYYA